MNEFSLPLRIGEDGARLEPSGLDPYELPWVQGAASTAHGRTKRRYPNGPTDLREKLAVLKSKRAKDTDAPTWGPRLRPAAFRGLDQRPLEADA